MLPLLKGMRRCTCRAIGLLRKAAFNRSISGVTPFCARARAGDGVSRESVGGETSRGAFSSTRRRLLAMVAAGAGAARLNSRLLVAPLLAAVLGGARWRRGAGRRRRAQQRRGLPVPAPAASRRIPTARAVVWGHQFARARAMARESITIMTAPTIVQRLSMVRTITAVRESPRSNPTRVPHSGRRTLRSPRAPRYVRRDHRALAQPQHVPCSSCNEIA